MDDHFLEDICKAAQKHYPDAKFDAITMMELIQVIYDLGAVCESHSLPVQEGDSHG